MIVFKSRCYIGNIQPDPEQLADSRFNGDARSVEALRIFLWFMRRGIEYLTR